jgi:hypothetical protein
MARQLLITLAMFIPGLALAAPRTFDELAANVVGILNAGIGVSIVLGLVIYFYGIATSIPRLRTDDSKRLAAHFFWGLLAIFVMVSVWGILALLRNTLFGGGGGPAFDDGPSGPLCTSIEDCAIE